MSRTLEFTDQLTVICCTHEGCGINFAVQEDYLAARRRDRATFYCPNGHGRWYPGKTDAQARKDAERDAANAAEEARIARAAATEATRELAKIKKAQAATKKRAQAALCPVDGCGRSFVQLSRHMHTKHPEFVHNHGGGAA